MDKNEKTGRAKSPSSFRVYNGLFIMYYKLFEKSYERIHYGGEDA